MNKYLIYINKYYKLKKIAKKTLAYKILYN